MSQQGLRRRVQELGSSLHAAALGQYGTKADYDNAADLRALLSAHAKAKRELAMIRKLARMSGVDKLWWTVGGVTL